MGFSTGEPKPPHTAPIGLETRNWLWKRVDLAGNELALSTNCEEQAEGKREIEPNCRSKTDMAGIDS